MSVIATPSTCQTVLRGSVPGETTFGCRPLSLPPTLMRRVVKFSRSARRW